MKKNDSLKCIIVMIAICLFIGVAMAAVNSITAPKIEEANKQKEMEALVAVLPTAESFENITPEGCDESVAAVYCDEGGDGYAVLLSIKGYDSSNPMSVAVGIDNDGKIVKCHVISCSGETSGIGTKVGESSFLDRFVGKDSSLDGVDTISGATISSKAFIKAVHAAHEAVELAKEGT